MAPDVRTTRSRLDQLRESGTSHGDRLSRLLQVQNDGVWGSGALIASHAADLSGLREREH